MNRKRRAAVVYFRPLYDREHLQIDCIIVPVKNARKYISDAVDQDGRGRFYETKPIHIG